MKDQLRKVLEDFVLIRTGKHRIYRHKVTGKLLVTSITPSDHRALQNIERDARKASRP